MQNDLISRSELIKRIKTFTNISDSYYQNTDMLLAEIYNMPTAYDVEKVADEIDILYVHGRFTRDNVLVTIRNGGKE